MCAWTPASLGRAEVLATHYRTLRSDWGPLADRPWLVLSQKRLVDLVLAGHRAAWRHTGSVEGGNPEDRSLSLLFEASGTPLLCQDRVPAGEAAFHGAGPSGD